VLSQVQLLNKLHNYGQKSHHMQDLFSEKDI
jgi:hypothetical protein